MDNVTHTLFALTLARTRLGRGGRGTTAALVLASNAPDIDIVATLGGSANYLAWHRGPTHGPLGVVGLGVVTAALVGAPDDVFSASGKPSRADSAPMPARSGRWSSSSMVGVLLHILMDLPTSYGTRLLSPFSWRWFAIDLPADHRHLSARSPSRRDSSSGAVRRQTPVDRRDRPLVLMAVNYGGRVIAHHEALLSPRGRSAAPAAAVRSSRTASIACRFVAPTGSRNAAATCSSTPPPCRHFSRRFSGASSDGFRRVLGLRRGPSTADFWRRSVQRTSATGGASPNQWTPAVVRGRRRRAPRKSSWVLAFPGAAIARLIGRTSPRSSSRTCDSPSVDPREQARCRPIHGHVALESGGTLQERLGHLVGRRSLVHDRCSETGRAAIVMPR